MMIIEALAGAYSPMLPIVLARVQNHIYILLSSLRLHSLQPETIAFENVVARKRRHYRVCGLEAHRCDNFAFLTARETSPDLEIVLARFGARIVRIFGFG